MFGSSSVKQSSATSAAGVGTFAPVNNISVNRRLIDLTEPMQLAVLVGLAALGFYAYKRFK